MEKIYNTLYLESQRSDTLLSVIKRRIKGSDGAEEHKSELKLGRESSIREFYDHFPNRVDTVAIT
jgi:hypothetical protein